MRTVLLSAVKDLRRHRSDPMGALLWIGIPLFVGGIIFLSFGGDDGPSPRSRLLIANQDGGFVSRLLVGAFAQGPLGDLFETLDVEETNGRARVEAGDAGALLVIPADFSSAVLREEPATLTLVSNPTQRIGPEIVEETLTMASDAVFYLHRLLGDEVRAIAADTLDVTSTADVSVRIGNVAQFLGEALREPVVRISERSDAEPSGADLNIGALFLPGILFMALLFMAQGVGEDLWREHRQNTLRRYLTTPHRVHGFLVGKTLAGAVLMAVATSLTLVAAAAGFGVALRVIPAAFLWSLIAGTMLTAGSFVLQSLAPSQRAGNVLSMAIVFPLMMLGGSFFPFEVMPGWMARIGAHTPNGWALGVLKDILFERGTSADLGMATVLAIGFTVGLFGIGAIYVRRRFASGA